MATKRQIYHKPGLIHGLAHALSRELDQSTATNHDLHAYDTQVIRNAQKMTKIEQGTVPEYDQITN